MRGSSISESVSQQLQESQQRIHLLEQELHQTNSGLLALAIELQKAEQNYRSIFENATEGIFRVSGDGRYLFANPAMAHILGYDQPGELTSLVSGMDYEQLLETGTVRQGIERQVSRRDGTVIWASENVRAVRDDQGQTLYFEGTMQDITERKKYQQEIARLDRLELMGKIAGGIAHEIRNPMTVVRGYLQMLQFKEEFASQHQRFETMIGEIDRANAIITEFLSLAKDKPEEMKRQNINSIVAALVPLIQADVAKNQVAVSVDLAEVPDVNLDEKEIRQVVLNLVRNGLEAMPQNGKLTIKTSSMQDRVILSIKDQGTGIPPEVLEKLGTPFFTTKETGTGLGLSICYRIAESHNARIEVETGKNGTTFMVSFPTPADQGTVNDA
jgi:PAS domain S-box-containing protein